MKTFILTWYPPNYRVVHFLNIITGTLSNQRVVHFGVDKHIGLKKAAQQLGIQYYTLSDWRSKRNAAAKSKKYQMSDEELKQRNLELERENAELRKANDILKDALGFFAKDRKK